MHVKNVLQLAKARKHKQVPCAVGCSIRCCLTPVASIASCSANRRIQASIVAGGSECRALTGHDSKCRCRSAFMMKVS